MLERRRQAPPPLDLEGQAEGLTIISLDDFQQLLRDVERVKQRRQEKLGAIKQMTAHLRETYGTADLEEARALRDKAHRRMTKRGEAYLAKKKELEALLAARPKEA